MSYKQKVSQNIEKLLKYTQGGNMKNEGLLKLEWAKEHMPIFKKLEEDFKKCKPFKGVNIALSIHLEAKTANLALL
jgi:adenosylhomocysteinase